MSAGTMASQGQRMCSASAAGIIQFPSGYDFAQRHLSRPLTSSLVSSSAIILATSSREQSFVTRLSPDARNRTFTMVEAALLAESVVAGRRTPWQASEAVTLDHVAAAMHHNRGVLVLPDTFWLRRFRGGSPVPRGLNIADVHTGEAKNHRAILGNLKWASKHFAQAVVTMTTQAP